MESLKDFYEPFMKRQLIQQNLVKLVDDFFVHALCPSAQVTCMSLLLMLSSVSTSASLLRSWEIRIPCCQICAPLQEGFPLDLVRFTGNEFKSSPEIGQEQMALPMNQQRQEIIQLENELVFNEAVIEEREQGIREIQQQIGEVNDIFKDLAVLVHDQGIMIDDIDSNVERSHSATVQANRQLAKASKTQRSNNSLSCLLIVIFAVALLIVIIVLAA